MIKKLTSLNLVVVVGLMIGVAGCSAVDLPEMLTRGQQSDTGSESGSGGFQTATPPTSPDLRGQTFPIVLFLVEDGPYSNLGNSISQAAGDGVADLNTRGGVIGAEIALSHVRVPADPAAAMELVLRTLEDVEPLVALMSAPVDEALFYEINQQEVPFLYFGLGGKNIDPSENQPGKLFWLIPPPEDQLSFFIHSIWGSWEDVRPAGTYNELRIGYLSGDGRPPDENLEVVLTRLEREHFSVPVTGVVPASANSSVSNFLMGSVQQGVTVIYSDTAPGGTAVLLNDIGTLAQEDAFLRGGAIWSFENQIEGRLLSSQMLEGYMLPLPIAWWNEHENPAIQMAQRIHKQAGRSADSLDAGYLLGLGGVDIIRAGLISAAVEKDSGQFGPEEVYQQFAEFEDYAVMDGLFQITYSGGQRYPSYMRLWAYEVGSGWSPVTDWGEVP